MLICCRVSRQETCLKQGPLSGLEVREDWWEGGAKKNGLFSCQWRKAGPNQKIKCSFVPVSAMEGVNALVGTEAWGVSRKPLCLGFLIHGELYLDASAAACAWHLCTWQSEFGYSSTCRKPWANSWNANLVINKDATWFLCTALWILKDLLIPVVYRPIVSIFSVRYFNVAGNSTWGCWLFCEAGSQAEFRHWGWGLGAREGGRALQVIETEWGVGLGPVLSHSNASNTAWRVC